METVLMLTYMEDEFYMLLNIYCGMRTIRENWEICFCISLGFKNLCTIYL